MQRADTARKPVAGGIVSTEIGRPIAEFQLDPIVTVQIGEAVVPAVQVQQAVQRALFKRGHRHRFSDGDMDRIAAAITKRQRRMARNASLVA